MKLENHVEHIRQLIDKAFRNRLGRMGINVNKLQDINSTPMEYHEDRKRIESILNVLTAETQSFQNAYEKLVEELTFTLFNRIAALKVMEAHTLHPEIITRRSQHGDRSFAHNLWLEQNPERRNEELEGLLNFFEDQMSSLSEEIPLFSLDYPYHLLPTGIELNTIIEAFNRVDLDPNVGSDVWSSDDILGWLYESYNNSKKEAHKASGDKTEYNKVSIQSQVYTPGWVVKFLVDNSLGKLYLEMYPDSRIKEKYKIANPPKSQIREIKPLTEVKIIDPVTGSGNFLLYAFDLFYDLYLDQIENYGASYDINRLPELIINYNLHGIDLDDRAVQLAQLGLYIKAKRKKQTAKIDHFNIVSSDFFLPEYEKVKHLFENGETLKPELEKIVRNIWSDLQQAYKFGSLIRLDEKFSISLHGLVSQFEGVQTHLFTEESLASYGQFKDNFLTNLQKAVSHNTAKQGRNFLNTKTADAIKFLELVTEKYDIAVANPPYTDSADYGPILKEFIDNNYKQPLKFNSNLYASFIKRCCEITNEVGYVGIIHPHTFMFIKTFEDVRKYLINNTHIELLVDYGLDRVNLFGPGILLEAVWYVLNKRLTKSPGIYFSIADNQQEKNKQKSLEQAYYDTLKNNENNRVYFLKQEKLKFIASWPFIYWISDEFREKFNGSKLEKNYDVVVGLQTGDTERFLRYWWEIQQVGVSDITNDKNHKWASYVKGGEYNKWYGNNWLLVNWENNGYEIKNFKDEKGRLKSRPQNTSYYFRNGITYTLNGSKGPSFRYLPSNFIFDVQSPSIFSENVEGDYYFIIAYLNSSLCLYILDCLNPTVNTTPGDVKRIPLIFLDKSIRKNLSGLALENIEIKKKLCSFQIIETLFMNNPLNYFPQTNLTDRVMSFFNYENNLISIILLNEAVINKSIFDIYNLTSSDREKVEQRMGKSIGNLPLLKEAKDTFLQENKMENVILLNHIEELSLSEFEEQKIRDIKQDFNSLYQTNNDISEFCIRHHINPINVWYWFKEARILPYARANDIALEFLTDAFRTILMEDNDGIVPLVGLPGEPKVIDRLEKYCLDKGFSSAQFMQLDGLLGRPLDEYIEHYFFKNLSDHLNLFMHLPKTPFIWHLSSGEYQGFEVYIIIYKWNRDSLFKLKSHYISKRVESLEYRAILLKDNDTAQAQNEKETIRMQLQEIGGFTKKIDELIAEGYDPKLDDGVGKNIAPLQKKGMLRAEVLKTKTSGKGMSELDKYLNADW